MVGRTLPSRAAATPLRLGDIRGGLRCADKDAHALDSSVLVDLTQPTSLGPRSSCPARSSITNTRQPAPIELGCQKRTKRAKSERLGPVPRLCQRPRAGRQRRRPRVDHYRVPWRAREQITAVCEARPRPLAPNVPRLLVNTCRDTRAPAGQTATVLPKWERRQIEERLLPRPLVGHRPGLPRLGDAAAFLAECVGIVGELSLEGELFAGILARVVDFGSPHGDGAQCLGV